MIENSHTLVKLLIPPARRGGNKRHVDVREVPEFQKALAKILPYLETEIVKRSDRAKGFAALPRRWIVERTSAWLNRCRRLAKDWENLNRKALAFLRLASIRLRVRKLCNPV
jgi:hypothetical protein